MTRTDGTAVTGCGLAGRLPWPGWTHTTGLGGVRPRYRRPRTLGPRGSWLAKRTAPARYIAGLSQTRGSGARHERRFPTQSRQAGRGPRMTTQRERACELSLTPRMPRAHEGTCDTGSGDGASHGRKLDKTSSCDETDCKLTTNLQRTVGTNLQRTEQRVALGRLRPASCWTNRSPTSSTTSSLEPGSRKRPEASRHATGEGQVRAPSSEDLDI